MDSSTSDSHRQHVGLCGRHGRSHRPRLRRPAQPLRGRPQRHHFQDRRRPPDFRLRHPGPSMAAYHLAFGPDGYLYVSGPTTSSFDSVHRISEQGEVEVFYRGLGRPQGIAFDEDGNLYIALPSADAAAWCASRPTARPSCFSPALGSWVWPSPHRAPWSSPPPTRCTASMSASRAGRWSNGR